jgi:hypothetical protein
MLTARDTAGARYAAALSELRAAYIDLAAHDKALLNRRFGSPSHIASFNGTQEQDGVPIGLRHPDFAPDGDGAWHNEVEAQADAYLADLKAG